MPEAMPPAIVTDSNVSLPRELVAELPLFIAPLEVRVGGKVYADGAEIPPAKFYAMLRTSPHPPTTSAPTPAAFFEAFERAGAVSKEIVCVTISAELSTTYAAAIEGAALARAYRSDLHITVIDSHSAAAAQGLIVLDAARLAHGGCTTAEVIERIHERMGDTVLLGYLGTLYYLARSGRIPRVASWMGSILRIKPLLRLSDGRIGMIERSRSDARAMRRIAALAASHVNGQPARVAVIHADEPDKAETLATLLSDKLALSELFITELTPVIGAHTGPGLIGCALHPVTDTSENSAG